MADDDDVVYPLTGNDDLIMAGLVPKDDDDIHDDTAVLLGIDVGSDSALINLDGGDGGGGAELVPSATTRSSGPALRRAGNSDNSAMARDTSMVSAP